jgi:acetyl esterase/lipase
MTRTLEQLPAFFGELAAWTAAAAVPAEVIRYGGHHDQRLELRGSGGPTVLVIHGGFWRAGFTLANTAALASALAQAGWTTANVEYRRGGPGTWRALLDDVRAAADAVGPAAAIGHSAGGHLAIWLAAERAVGSAVALGGVCDLVAGARTHVGGGAVQEFLGGEPADVPEAYAAADPARKLPLGRPHALVHGTEDDRVPVALARAYAARAGADCRLLEIEGADHFDVIDPRSAAWPVVHGTLEQLVATATGDED